MFEKEKIKSRFSFFENKPEVKKKSFLKSCAFALSSLFQVFSYFLGGLATLFLVIIMFADYPDQPQYRGSPGSDVPLSMPNLNNQYQQIKINETNDFNLEIINLLQSQKKSELNEIVKSLQTRNTVDVSMVTEDSIILSHTGANFTNQYLIHINPNKATIRLSNADPDTLLDFNSRLKRLNNKKVDWSIIDSPLFKTNQNIDHQQDLSIEIKR